MNYAHICLFLFIIHAVFAFESHASILDLLTWNLEEKSEVTKRDDSNSNHAQLCDCKDSLCTCCVDFDMVFIDFGGPACVHMEYVSEEQGIAVNVTYGERTLNSVEIKGPNPAPTCMPLLEDLAEVCTQFTNLHPVDDGFKGCLQFQPKVLDQTQARIDVGCFTIGKQGMKFDTLTNLTRVLALNTTTTKEPESEEFNEEELIAAVNETAEKGLAFVGKLLGFFGKPDVNQSNIQSSTETNTDIESSSASIRTRLSLSSTRNKVL